MCTSLVFCAWREFFLSVQILERVITWDKQVFASFFIGLFLCVCIFIYIHLQFTVVEQEALKETTKYTTIFYIFKSFTCKNTRVNGSLRRSSQQTTKYISSSKARKRKPFILSWWFWLVVRTPRNCFAISRVACSVVRRHSTNLLDTKIIYC